MLVEQVKNLPPLERFLYWIRERFNIGRRRAARRPKPWTDDEILRDFFFTWPYRELDKTTVWFRENVRDPLRVDPRVILATIIFRWFNYIPTGEVLLSAGEPERTPDDYGLLDNWSPELALKLLGGIRDGGGQIFTGAFMINSPGGEPKLEAIVRRVTQVWDAREMLEGEFSRGAYERKITLEGAHDLLTEFEGMGGFMAYEVVCDLRYTVYLEHAPDKMTWCNVGPGARRGLYRILGVDFAKGENASSLPRLPDEMGEMRKLLAICNHRLRGMPPFEMREVEMSLCEIDKYERLLWNDGRAKRRYNGRG